MDWSALWVIFRTLGPSLLGLLGGIVIASMLRETEWGSSEGYAFLNGCRRVRYIFLNPWYKLQCKVHDLAHRRDPEDPFLGYKQALMVCDHRGKVLGFAPLTANKIYYQERYYGSDVDSRRLYEVVDTATCGRFNCNLVPARGCHCGFYALKRRKHINKVHGSWVHAGRMGNFAAVTLDVELYGKVIEGSMGFRAEKQSVLRVHCKNRCGMCARDKRFPFFVRKATSFDFFGSHKLSNDLLYVLPVCEKHTTSHSKTLQDIASDLGTEVVWQK